MSVIKLLVTAFVLVGIAGNLAGCGKKGDLEAPPTKEETKETPKKNQS